MADTVTKPSSSAEAALDPSGRLAKPLKLLVGIALLVLAVVLVWKTNIIFASEKAPRRRIGPLEAPRYLPPILRRAPDPLDLEEPEGPRPLRIMLLGDSITQGCCDGKHLGYRYALWEELKRHGHAGHFEFIGSIAKIRAPHLNDSAVSNIKDNYPKFDEFMREAPYHEGHAGAMSRDLWGPLDEMLFRQRPDIVVVLLGINDLTRTRPDPRRAQRAFKDMMDLPDKMLKFSPSGTMLLCSLVPPKAPPSDFDKYNSMVQQVAEKWSLPYVDLTQGYDGVKDNYDEIHPDYSGERKIAEKIYDKLVIHLPPPSSEKKEDYA